MSPERENHAQEKTDDLKLTLVNDHYQVGGKEYQRNKKTKEKMDDAFIFKKSSSKISILCSFLQIQK
jgi:hypothetical protein